MLNRYLIMLGAVIPLLIYAMYAQAYASSSVECMPDTARIGDRVECIVYTDDANIDDLHIEVIDPLWLDMPVRIDIDPWDDNGVYDEDRDPNEKAYRFEFVPNMAGRWQIWVGFTEQGWLSEEVEISYLVVPEYVIGSLASIVSSLAVLGAFLRLRHRK